LIVLFAFSFALAAQHGSTTKSNPFNSPGDVAEGARIFRSHCAACHGPGGQGGDAGPDLTTGSFKRNDSDEALFATISKGIPGTSMPGFAGSGKQVWQLAAYVRTLSVGRAAERAKGDAAAGAKLFHSAGCVNCHAVRGEGGIGGPDLADVGARRSLADLHRSLIDPDADVHPDYWRLSARTLTGEQIEGIRTNEDTFSYQYRQGRRLLSVLKQDLAAHRILRTSSMPSYKDKLTASELDHLIAWLASRRGGEAK
jgi:cytochrome c oxidase cbb3-type subunit III